MPVVIAAFDGVSDGDVTAWSGGRRLNRVVWPSVSDTTPVTPVARRCETPDRDRAEAHDVSVAPSATDAGALMATMWPSLQIGHTRRDTPVSASTRSR